MQICVEQKQKNVEYGIRGSFIVDKSNLKIPLKIEKKKKRKKEKKLEYKFNR